MHRTFRRPWALLGAVALLLGTLAAPARAQLCTPESRPVVVLLNGATRLSMTSRKPIKTVLNPKEGLLTLRTVEGDPTTVILLGVAPGVTRLELTDADGGTETREVVVQADVEYLTRQIRRAIPLANIDVIPNGAQSVILTGYVGRAEDIQLAQQVAQTAGFASLNGLRLNGVQQVQLDVVIARVSRTKGRNFGFNFLVTARQNVFGSTVGNVAGGININPIGVPSAVLQPSQFGQTINALPNNGNLFGGIIGNATGFLSFLQALETEGLAKLLAQPRLTTLSGNPASFLDGGEQAVPVPAGLGQIGVQFEEFGTRLNFVPVVLGNGRIHLEVEPEVSVLDAASGTAIQGTVVPGRSTQRIRTTVEMETGQTFVIGGLIQRTTVANAQKVPVLGQLPLFGALFSTKTYTEAETELVVMVTPHLVDAQSAAQLVKVLPGQETRTPDDFELFLEGILEAPRGPRSVFHGNRYVPAHRNGPTATLFPCAGQADGFHSRHHGWGRGAGCAPAANGCAAPAAPVAPAQPAAAPAPVIAPAHEEPAPPPVHQTVGELPPPLSGTEKPEQPLPPPGPPGGSLSAETPPAGAEPAKPADPAAPVLPVPSNDAPPPPPLPGPPGGK